MSDLATHGTPLLRRAADRVAQGITTGHDWPNSDDELARLQAARLLRECADEIERLRAVVDAAQEWAGERFVSDWDEATLMKALWTFNGDRLKPCPECDGECGEPCAPCTVVAAHAAIDERLKLLVKQGKIYDGEAIK